MGTILHDALVALIAIPIIAVFLVTVGGAVWMVGGAAWMLYCKATGRHAFGSPPR